MSKEALAVVENVEAGGQIENSNWPIPVGWRILVDPLEPKSVSDGGIILADETTQAEMHLNYVGRVVASGPLCYRHSKFADGGEWCKVGDWIAYGQYAGQTITVKDNDAADRSAKIRKECEEKEEVLHGCNEHIKNTMGTDAHRDALQSKIDVDSELTELRRRLAQAEKDIEHRLRLLNDDEVLAVIPNTEAIKIYL